MPFYLFSKKHINEILLIIVLIFSLVIRVANFNIESIYSNWDGNRLYLVANHIVTHGEFPQVGASTGYIPELKKSPFWYYFAAALLLIKNDILFLGWVNVFLSVATIFIVYLLARAMFGKSTALIATILFSFSEFSFQQAIFHIWDASVAQTFLILSLLIFIISYHKKNYFLLLIGIFIFAIASATNLSSGVFVLPAVLLLIFYILKKQKRQAVYYFGALATVFIAFLVFFLPVAIYQMTNSVSLSPLGPRKGLIALSDFLPELGSLFYIFSDGYFLNLDRNLLSLNNFLFFTIVGGIIYSFLALKGKTKTMYYFLIIIFILTPLAIIALFQINRPFYDPQTMPIYGLLRYFLASIVLFIILISDVISSSLSRPFLQPLKMFFILGLIYISFPSLSNSINNLPIKVSKNLHSQTPNAPAVQAVQEEATNIKNKENFKDYNFFQITTYTRGKDGDYTLDNPSFWVILEKNLSTKLVEISNKNTWTYRQTGVSEVIFLVCLGYPNEEDKTCIDSFQRENAGYSIVKQIYSQFPHSIYVTKKINL